MNGPRGPRSRIAVGQPPAGLSLHAGTLRSGWCTKCKAWTYISTDLVLLTSSGVSTLGTWEWCEICDDPDDPLPARRIDRAGP
ncbi:hypothetical protein [Streptomyces kronopolitis]|uniref:hypothetical protein n=1 Tax=Streptomyces kronopolitis TaxID=1612435 RepID=UPI00342E1F53